MKFGVLQFFSWPERRVPLETVYERAFQRIDIMDRGGYDCVWLAEHHFTSFSICPSVHLMATHIATRTRNLRIGTAISLVPFYHPLRLAEEVALLDILSGGRVNWGAGRGYQQGEFDAFGVSPRESYDIFREHVEVVLRAWTEERVTYQGRYVEIHDVEVLPKPRQQPHPPVWLAASSAEAMTWAARRGFDIMLDPHSTHRDIGRKREFYRTVLEENGHTVTGRQIPMARLVAVAETRAEAEETARRGARWTVSSHAQSRHRFAQTGSRLNRERRDLSAMAAIEGLEGQAQDPVERYLNGIILYGTPAEVIDEIERLKEEMFLDYLLCAPLSHKSFVQFTDKVLPHFV